MESKKKRGRQKTCNAKTGRINVRISGETEEKLRICSERANMTKSGVITAGIELVYDKIKSKGV